jgi:hypothetical protein
LTREEKVHHRAHREHREKPIVCTDRDHGSLFVEPQFHLGLLSVTSVASLVKSLIGIHSKELIVFSARALKDYLSAYAPWTSVFRTLKDYHGRLYTQGVQVQSPRTQFYRLAVGH